jgi:DNA-binding HxlR family transcriptional regulator
MEQGSVTDVCPLAETAKLIGDTYVLLILRDLSAGPSRFVHLERTAGINSRTLTERLRRLEHDGLVRRTLYPEVPPRVEYELTEKGAALLPILDAMRAYGERWLVGATARAGEQKTGGDAP